MSESVSESEFRTTCFPSTVVFLLPPEFVEDCEALRGGAVVVVGLDICFESTGGCFEGISTARVGDGVGLVWDDASPWRASVRGVGHIRGALGSKSVCQRDGLGCASQVEVPLSAGSFAAGFVAGLKNCLISLVCAISTPH